MKPSDADLNRAMAEAIGWEHHKGYWFREADGQTLQSAGVPAFCSDRNALPDVWSAIPANLAPCFGHHLCRMLGIDSCSPVEAVACLVVAVPPRLHVVAALRALGKWKEGWETE